MKALVSTSYVVFNRTMSTENVWPTKLELSHTNYTLQLRPYAMALCPSDCPFVKSQCTTKMAKCRIMLTAPRNSGGIVLF